MMSQNHAWVKDPREVQPRSMAFDITEKEHGIALVRECPGAEGSDRG